MRILVVCDQGVNRSVTLAHQLKYLGHDVLSAGLARNSQETLELLFDWAEKIITTEGCQSIPEQHAAKTELWDIGPDYYPRPHNKALLRIVRRLIDEHHDEFKSAAAAL
jgi:CheY-like chemotaxis protein